MKLIKLFFLVFGAIQISNSQNDSSKKGIKRILYTETNRQLLDNGEHYNYITETNETLYDKKGLKQKSVRIIYNNSLPKNKKETTYHYNEKDQIIFSSSFIDKDSTQIKTNYVYHDDLLIKIHFNYIKNETEFKFEETYNYNIENKLVSSNYIYYEKYIDSDFDDYITFLILKEKYDKKERTIEMDWTGSNERYKHNKFIYKWRKNKLLANEKEFDKNNKLIRKKRFKYALDNKENWIVKKEIENKIINKITYREIDYYE
ncbi:hypothetical protein [Winogradskyella sp. PE311]|uniref:hypothetical protein n=1 Tax=Winogradskyella sp. PE311 TaxID=3366943 RepID=UPI0039816E89